MFKRQSGKGLSLNMGAILCLILAVCFICTVLIQDELAPASISAMLSALGHWARHWHVLAIGLLPVYIALMVFGTAVVGIYLGSVLHRWLAMVLRRQQ